MQNEKLQFSFNEYTKHIFMTFYYYYSCECLINSQANERMDGTYSLSNRFMDEQNEKNKSGRETRVRAAAPKTTK